MIGVDGPDLPPGERNVAWVERFETLQARQKMKLRAGRLSLVGMEAVVESISSVGCPRG